MAITPEGYKVECPAGLPRLSGIASSAKPKLYVVSVDEVPVYVGITTQRMSARLSFGWRAKGEKGYHGYPMFRQEDWERIIVMALCTVSSFKHRQKIQSLRIRPFLVSLIH